METVEPDVATQQIEIRHRWTNAVLWTGTAQDVRAVAIQAVKSGANLRGANLRGANLRGANLRDANLGGANLRDANLGGANLGGADLGGADLGGANLGGANLGGADLGGANLGGANLGGANLGGADLGGANLRPIRDDFWAVLSSAPKEVLSLRAAIVAGKINGSTYCEGDCGCLVGTLEIAAKSMGDSLPLLARNSTRPAEMFFLGISIGDTPETNQFSAIALGWLDQWVDGVKSAFGATP